MVLGNMTISGLVSHLQTNDWRKSLKLHVDGVRRSVVHVHLCLSKEYSQPYTCAVSSQMPLPCPTFIPVHTVPTSLTDHINTHCFHAIITHVAYTYTCTYIHTHSHTHTYTHTHIYTHIHTHTHTHTHTHNHTTQYLHMSLFPPSTQTASSGHTNGQYRRKGAFELLHLPGHLRPSSCHTCTGDRQLRRFCILVDLSLVLWRKQSEGARRKKREWRRENTREQRYRRN
jgi:hypothetical protein